MTRDEVVGQAIILFDDDRAFNDLSNSYLKYILFYTSSMEFHKDVVDSGKGRRMLPDQEKLKLRQRPPETAIAPHRRQRRHSGGPSYIETWVHRGQIHRHPELVKVAIVIALIVLKVVKVAQSEHDKNAKQFIYCNKNKYYMYITGSLTPAKGEWILRQIGRAGEGGKGACNVLE
ncbi:hypothetical protein R3P38DRAFT_3366721 [Favolaschia claudopus]|uniref:Uncharacterized protein n=1 Tax=Favolaschia claudopus TaxID=2862362 RepID=A0AAW0ACG1_9AGAR